MKILLIGVEFYSYANAMECALQELGHEVYTYVLKDFYSATLKGRIYQKRRNTIMCAEGRASELYLPPDFVWEREGEVVLKLYNKYKPELVIGFAAYFLSAKVLQAMNATYKILWIYDSIKRLPRVQASLKYYNKICTFEGTEVEYISKMGCDSDFLPLCADSSIYHPMQYKKDVDILFAGGMTQERLMILREIDKSFPNLKKIVYGKYLEHFDIKGHIIRVKNKENLTFRNANILPESLNILYSRSKICLNIHQNQSRYGGNMRLYEILSAGGFQIVDYNPYIENNFAECVATYRNTKELIKLIEYYLNYPEKRESISKRGYETVMHRDLFIHRAEKMVSDYLRTL